MVFDAAPDIHHTIGEAWSTAAQLWCALAAARIAVGAGSNYDDVPTVSHFKDDCLPPARAPECIDGYSPSGVACGFEAGGACADIRDYGPPVLLDQSSELNGDYSALHRCCEDANTDRPMRCLDERFNGSDGTNVFGG